ncbi:MAG: RNA polymerase sigma factor [Planctomycetota bacterium]
MPEETRSDAELIRRHVSGEASAFEAIASRHAPMVYRACLRLLGDAHEAEDAAQAVFVILARKAARLRKSGDLAAWLHGISRRVASEARRSRKRRRRREEEGAVIRAARSKEGLSDAERTAALEALDREVGALPAGQRQAVVLRYLEGLSLEEAAGVAGCPEGTLGRRAHEGLARLRARLGGRGFRLGGAALAALLEAEAGAAVPATLVPSVVTASQAAALGAAAGAGAVGAKAILLAEGTMKAMLMFKVKVAAAVLGAVLLAGAAAPLTRSLVSAGERGDPVADPAGAPTAPKRAPGAMAWGKAVDGLQLSLSCDMATCTPGENATLTFRLKNVSAKGIRIAGLQDGSGPYVLLEISDHQGKKLEPYSDHRGPGTKYWVLKPGEEAVRTFSLQDYFRIGEIWWPTKAMKAGVYAIKGKYCHNPAAWEGKVFSNDIAVTIRAPLIWGQVADGLQVGAVPLGGDAGKGWVRQLCPDPGCRNLGRMLVMNKCSKCGAQCNSNQKLKFCRACAAAARACSACGKAKPSSAQFAEGQPMRFELHFKNTGKDALKLFDAGWAGTWSVTFTSEKGEQIKPRFLVDHLMDRMMLNVDVPAGSSAMAELSLMGKTARGPKQWGPESLAPGEYTVVFSYGPKGGPEFWKGTASTTPLKIAVGAPPGAPDEAAARRLTLEWIKREKRDETWKPFNLGAPVGGDQITVLPAGGSFKDTHWQVTIKFKRGGVFGLHVKKDDGKILLPRD